MSDLKELFDMVTNKTEPDLDSWKEQETRQRRTVRNRKVGAMIAVAAILVLVAGFVVIARPSDDAQTPATTQSLAPSPPPLELEPDVQDVAAIGLDGVPFAAVPNIPQDAAYLDLSPDGNTLTFTTVEGIWTMSVDGRDARLINGSAGVRAPAWSPDGGQIAFEREREDQFDIAVMQADGSDVHSLTNGAGNELTPNWSPDGSTIAYVQVDPADTDVDTQFAASADIWTIPSSGGDPTQLTDARGSDFSFDYSPSGDQLVFWHDIRLMVMDADGGSPRTLTEDHGFTPAWSPDGTRIAYGIYDDSFRPEIDIAGWVNPNGAPLLRLAVVDVATGVTERVGDVGFAYDVNRPIWLSNDQLLIHRAGTP